MRKLSAVALIAVFIAAAAFAHAGHVHNFLGTVKSLAGDQLTITTRDGKDATFVLTNKTAYLRDGKPARREDLLTGLRIAVHVADDGKTAVSVKLGKN